MGRTENPTDRAGAVISLVGNTPMVPLRFQPEDVVLLAKCEFMNPSGSIKDRFAASVIFDAERRGALNANSVILECTSGNTGVSLAMVGAAKGYAVTILMSEGASAERRHLICQLGAELILFDSKGGYHTGINLCQW
jgi:cysteine synthase A